MLFVVVLASSVAADPTPTVAASPTPTSSADASSPSCNFASSSYSGFLNEPLSFSLNVSQGCRGFSASYSCRAGGELRTVVVPPSECAAVVAPAYSFNCSYNETGTYAINASVLLESHALSCGTANATVSCSPSQNGLACGNSSYCCSGSCKPYPSTCPSCQTNSSPVCQQGNWTCSTLPDGTACSDTCTPQLLSVGGQCQQGACVAQNVSCAVSNYCGKQDCGGSTYACTFSPASGLFEWSNNTLLCEGNAACPASACVMAGANFTWLAFNQTASVCTLAQSACFAGGCCRASCNAEEGCSTLGGPCADVCSKDVVKISGACQGCGANGSFGSCAYTELRCGPLNECQPASCAGSLTYCRNVQGRFEWSNDTSPCSVVRPSPTSSGSGSQPYTPPPSGGGSTPTPVVSVDISAEFAAITPLPSNALIMHEVQATTLPELANASEASIGILGYYFFPQVTNENRRTDAFVFTDSSSRLQSELKCEGPSRCICRPPYNNSHSNFVCQIFPPVNGSYVIRLGNAENASGVFIANLVPGKEATLYRVVVPLRSREFLLYGAILAGAVLLGYAIYRAVRDPLKKMGEKPMLERRRQELLKEMEYIKYRYLKREISDDEFKEAMLSREKELTEIKARLANLERQKTPPTKT